MAINRKYLYAVLLLGVVVALIFKQSLDKNVDELTPTLSTFNSDMDSVSDKNQEIFNSKAPSENGVVKPSSVEEKIIFNNWHAARGKFVYIDGPGRDEYGNKIPDAYETYDNETLRQLGNTGDLRALHELADRSETIAEHNVILEKAAVFGSTQALDKLGLMTELTASLSDKTPEEKKPIVIESMAYYEAAVLRGDWEGKLTFGRSLLGKHPVDLTDEDYNTIQKRSQEIYNNIQAKRYELGLGDFDNSIPDSVMESYSMSLAAHAANAERYKKLYEDYSAQHEKLKSEPIDPELIKSMKEKERKIIEVERTTVSQ